MHNHSTCKSENERIKKTHVFVQQKTDAQLMAASKDMYEALTMMLYAKKHGEALNGMVFNEATEFAVKAIAKAEREL